MKITLTVDTRENKLIPLLGNEVIVKNLDVGDFLYQINDKPTLVIERKTYPDLASSIQGGRYREQKLRLNQSDAQLKAYLIEGPYPRSANKFNRITPSTMDSAILGTTIRDGFLLIRSESLKHTAELLLKLLKKLPEYVKSLNTDNTTSNGPNEYLSVISSINITKKENITVENCYVLQLCQIPGVSHNTALAITNRYYCMYDLMRDIKEDEELATNRISELRMETRKIGLVLAKTIVEFLKPRKRVKKTLVIKTKSMT